MMQNPNQSKLFFEILIQTVTALFLKHPPLFFSSVLYSARLLIFHTEAAFEVGKAVALLF